MAGEACGTTTMAKLGEEFGVGRQEVLHKPGQGPPTRTRAALCALSLRHFVPALQTDSLQLRTLVSEQDLMSAVPQEEFNSCVLSCKTRERKKNNDFV